jgi:TetR/AcrR family transcriptional regulator, transcriptional repressor for nem operon
MTDSDRVRRVEKRVDGDDRTMRAGKRERLVEGARRVFHEQGVHGTTLADIAEAADVPVGNLYYYFKTKDELVEAAVDAHADEIQTRLAEFERHRTPAARLKALALGVTELADEVARYGCPHGTLCVELAKRDDGLDRRAAKLVALTIDWAEEQFRLMGKRDARDLAVGLVAAIQGTSLLTSSLRDPEIMTRQAHRLARWIDDLAKTAKA